MNKNRAIQTIGIAITLTVPVYVVYLWFTVQSQYFSYGNNSWLMVAAERMLSGQSPLEHFYESNPPLSIIIYIPHVIYSWLLGLSMPVASFYMTTIEIAASLILSALIIKKFDFLSYSQKILFLITFLISMTIAAGIFISEREHIIFIWLIPFILCQFAISEHIKISAYIYLPALIIGSIMILVKPHYGIIPVTLFLIRLGYHKKFFAIYKDVDFIILKITTILYAIYLFTISDYGNLILPDVMRLYGTSSALPIVLNVVIGYISVSVPLLIFELALNDIKSQKKRFLNLFHLCLFLSFIPYFVQMKGFPNHIIPIYGFFILSLSASLILRTDKLPKKTAAFSPAICAALILVSVLNYSPLSTKTLKHSDIQNLKAFKYIQTHCSAPCTYYAFHTDMEVFNPISAYSGMINGTRYGSYWWLPKLYFNTQDNDQNIQTKDQQIKERFLRYTAEDIKNYKPKLLLIKQDMHLGNGHHIDFIQYFSENPDFKKIIQEQYIKIDEVTFDFKDYYKGTNFKGIEGGYKYDVYKRKPAFPL